MFTLYSTKAIFVNRLRTVKKIVKPQLKCPPKTNGGSCHAPVTLLGYIRRMKYTMSAKELARLPVIKGAIDGVYTVKQVARKLAGSTRRVKRLAVIHGNPGPAILLLENLW
jgi:hypothetical protein